MFGIDVLPNRLDQLEAKVLKIGGVHGMEINSQKEEILAQLKNTNAELIQNHKNKQLIQVGNDVNIRDFMPRSCFELKATNPAAQSGNYFIDPDGQIDAEPPILVYCDMTTRMKYMSIVNLC